MRELAHNGVSHAVEDNRDVAQEVVWGDGFRVNSNLMNACGGRVVWVLRLSVVDQNDC